MDYVKYEDIYSEFSCNPQKYIEKCEDRFEDFVQKCADKIIKEDVKRVFICGQSGSGKTTSSLRMAEKLKKAGKTCHIIELDDFFLGRGKHKKNKAGKEDFESIFALDLKSIYKFSQNIKENKKVVMPDFDFTVGKKGSEIEIEVGNDDILIIEGIHSFNKRILNAFSVENKNLKIFVTVNSCVEFDKTKLSNNDLRFARRLVRDYHHRNANPDWTIELWHMVRAGEKRYATDYMKNADILFNTFINYELFVLRNDFVKLAEEGVKTAESKGYYRTLLHKYNKINETEKIKIPKNSILNEFI